MVASSRTWQENFDALVKYQAEHSNCLVPRSFKDSALVSWVKILRMRRATLKKELVEALDSIGFEWGRSALLKSNQSVHSIEDKWHKMFARLLEFKIRNEGSCRVPLRFRQDRQLGLWVARQRRRYRVNTLSLQQRKLLEDINFHSDLLVRDNKYCRAMESKGGTWPNHCVFTGQDSMLHEGSLSTNPEKVPRDQQDLLMITQLLLHDQLTEWSSSPDEMQQALQRLLTVNPLHSVIHSSDDTTGGTTDEATSVDSTTDDVGDFDDTPVDNTDLDTLAVLVYDLCALLGKSTPSCETQLSDWSEFLDRMILSLRRGRDPCPLHLTWSDPFSRLVPLVEEMVYLVDMTNDEDVKIVRSCEMVLAQAITKMVGSNSKEEDATGL
jgi:Helicase associated domain